MNKKEYMQPSMKVVKVKASQLLSGSPEHQIHNEVSNNASYTRESSWMDEE